MNLKRSICPITNTLDIIGDRWSLIVIRDLFLGKRLYSELLRSPEKISSNILADRLQRLERSGLIEKKAYQQNPIRYEYRLTPMGQDLRPLLREIMRWADRYIPGVERFPDHVR